ncbi:TPA: hypothetical protein QCR51_005435 [Bacillus cereus]|nr:hypothetical protein [Bacillus cereus]
MTNCCNSPEDFTLIISGLLTTTAPTYQVSQMSVINVSSIPISVNEASLSIFQVASI